MTRIRRRSEVTLGNLFENRFFRQFRDLDKKVPEIREVLVEAENLVGDVAVAALNTGFIEGYLGQKWKIVETALMIGAEAHGISAEEINFDLYRNLYDLGQKLRELILTSLRDEAKKRELVSNRESFNSFVRIVLAKIILTNTTSTEGS